MLRLALLWWKDWKWQKRNWTLDIALIIVPLLGAAVTSVVQFGDYTPHHQQEAIIAHETLLKPSDNYVPPFKYEVFFPFKAGGVEYDEFKTFCWQFCRGYDLKSYKKKDSIKPNSTYDGFVLISEWNVAAPSLKYQIVDLKWSLQRNLAPYWGLWSVDQLSTDHQQGNIYAAISQQLIDAHFYNRRQLLKKPRNLTTRSSRNSFRGLLDLTVHHAAMPLFNPSTAGTTIVIGQIISFSALLLVWRTMAQVKAEREARTKVLLAELGIGRFQYFSALSVPIFMKFFIMQILTWIVPICTMTGAFDIQLIVAGCVIYSAVLTSFSLLMTVMFNHQTAARIGSLVLMIYLHLGQLSQLESSSLRRHSILASFIFPSAYYYYLRAAATRLAVGGFVPDSGATSLETAPFLLLSAVVMFKLTLYLDVVYPGDGRRGLNLGFPFYFRYWITKSGAPQYETDDFMREIILIEEEKSEIKNDFKKKTANEIPIEKLSSIQLEGVCKHLHGMWTVNRVTMKAYLEEITILYGPRGSGGSEILDLIAGRMKPDHGKVDVANIEGGMKQSVSLATAPCLVPNLTVRELASWVTKLRAAEEIDTDYMMEDLSLKAVEHMKVCDLNVTQKQQLNLLLAFVGDSDIILLDEPTINCSPGVRNSMHAFIMSRKQGRTIVISTYDPLDAEIGDAVAFLTYGHLVSLGSVKSVREKYINSINLIVWPSGNFDKYQRMMVQKIIDNEIPKELRRTSWELMPNESIRFFVPNHPTIPFHKIMADLHEKRVQLGVKYFEMQRQNMQDAYFNCIRKAEQADDMDCNVLAVPLETFYKEPRTKSSFPELGCMIKIRIAYIRANLISYTGSIVATSLLVAFVFLMIFNSFKTAEEVKIDISMLDSGLSHSSQVFTNIPLRYSMPSSVEKVTKGDFKALIEGKLLYEEPAIAAGVYQDNETGIYHLYSMKTLRFADMLAQNMLINSIIDSPTENQVVHTTVEGPESPTWATIQSMEDDTDLVPGLSFSRRQLATIVVRQWRGILFLGGVIAIMLAKAAMQVAKMSSVNCIQMFFLSGARPFPFWASLFMVDTAMFLIAFVASFPALILLGDIGGIAIGAMSLFAVMAFATFLPFVYCFALRCRDAFTTYIGFLFLFGTFSVLPAAFLIFVKQYGRTLEEWSGLLVIIAFVCPPLAASLGTAIINDMINVQKKEPGQAFGEVWVLMVASCVHVWLWLLLFLFNWSFVHRTWTKLVFKFEELTADPKTFGDYEASDVNIRDTQHTAVAPDSNVGDSNVSNVSQRAAGGNDPEKTTMTKRCDPKMAEYTTLLLVEKIRAANAQPQQDSQVDSQAPVEDNGKTKMIGLWETRDMNRSKDPVLNFDQVTLGHYMDKSHKVTMTVFDSQSLNLFGDFPDLRSALLDMAAGQSYPKTGNVLVMGKKAGIGSNIGYVPKDDRLCTFLTGRGTLEMVARLKKYKNVKDVVNYILQVTELEEVADRFVENYGVSDRRMLQFAVAVVDRPTALLLDELDMYVSPTRMKTIWAIACFLRDKCQVPIVFSTPRVWECEATSSHTVMLNRGAVSLAETTLDIKKRFSSLATLTITVKKNIDMDMVQQVIVSQLECQVQPHPHPDKLSFLLTIPTGQYIDTLTRVRSLMTTIGMNDYQLDTPDLDIIYHANFTSYVVL